MNQMFECLEYSEVCDWVIFQLMCDGYFEMDVDGVIFIVNFVFC